MNFNSKRINPSKQPPGWTARREADAKRQGAQVIKPKAARVGFTAPRRDSRPPHG